MRLVWLALSRRRRLLLLMQLVARWPLRLRLLLLLLLLRRLMMPRMPSGRGLLFGGDIASLWALLLLDLLLRLLGWQPR